MGNDVGTIHDFNTGDFPVEVGNYIYIYIHMYIYIHAVYRSISHMILSIPDFTHLRAFS